HGQCQGCLRPAGRRHRGDSEAGYGGGDGRNALAILRRLSAIDAALPQPARARGRQVACRHCQDLLDLVHLLPEDQGSRPMSSFSRGDLLQLTVGGLAAGGSRTAMAAAPPASLGAIAAKNGYLFGAAAAEVIDKDPAYRDLYVTQTKIITT